MIRLFFYSSHLTKPGIQSNPGNNQLFLTQRNSFSNTVGAMQGRAVDCDLDLDFQLSELYRHCIAKTMMAKHVAQPLLKAVFQLAENVTSKRLCDCSSMEREHNARMYLTWDRVDDGQVSWYTIKHAMFLRIIQNDPEIDQQNKRTIFQVEHPVSSNITVKT